MDRREALAGIIDAIADHFFISPELVTEKTTASDIDGWDSLSHVTLILEIERRFNIRLPVRRTTEANNVGQLVEVLMEFGDER